MALRLLCPTFISARVVARKSSCIAGLQSFSRPHPSKNALLRYKPWSNVSPIHDIRLFRTQTAERHFVPRAALDEDHEQNDLSERSESADREIMAAGKRGDPKENGKQRPKNDSKEFDQPLFITVMLLSAYTIMALSFIPPQFHGPFGSLYTFLEGLSGSNRNARYASAGGFIIHVGEALYARHLALILDPENVGRWVKSVLFYGLFSLTRLVAKANGTKAE